MDGTDDLYEKDEVPEIRERLNSLRKQNSARANMTFRRGESQSSLRMNMYQPTIITETRRKIEDLCRDLVVNNDHIHCVEQRMRVAFDQGLSRVGNEKASVKCFPTYVRYLPSGEETGKFLALDLGGTNFRVLLIDIKPERKFKMDSKVFAIPQDIMEGPGHQLFDHIAKCLAEFVQEKNLPAGETEKLALGFTFSFPCKQEGLAVGKLTSWTKGFKCEGVEGEDVVQLLKQALARRGDVNLEVCAILNDTTGCLMSCAWHNPKCRIGLIIGTGTNACYLEDIKNVGTVGRGSWGAQARDHQHRVGRIWG